MTFLGPENFVRFEKHQKAFSGALRGAFRAREVLGSFEKRTPGRQICIAAATRAIFLLAQVMRFFQILSRRQREMKIARVATLELARRQVKKLQEKSRQN